MNMQFPDGWTIKGPVKTPELDESAGRARCPGCKTKHKKGAPVVVLLVNLGPTGEVHYCLKHAKKLGQDLIAIVEKAKAK